MNSQNQRLPPDECGNIEKIELITLSSDDEDSEERESVRTSRTVDSGYNPCACSQTSSNALDANAANYLSDSAITTAYMSDDELQDVVQPCSTSPMFHDTDSPIEPKMPEGLNVTVFLGSSNKKRPHETTTRNVARKSINKKTSSSKKSESASTISPDASLEPPARKQCPKCRKNFTNLSQHQKRSPNCKPVLKEPEILLDKRCRFCHAMGFRFDSILETKRHYRQFHLSTCIQCAEKFHNARDRADHEREVHWLQYSLDSDSEEVLESQKSLTSKNSNHPKKVVKPSNSSRKSTSKSKITLQDTPISEYKVTFLPSSLESLAEQTTVQSCHETERVPIETSEKEAGCNGVPANSNSSRPETELPTKNHSDENFEKALPCVPKMSVDLCKVVETIPTFQNAKSLSFSALNCTATTSSESIRQKYTAQFTENLCVLSINRADKLKKRVKENSVINFQNSIEIDCMPEDVVETPEMKLPSALLKEHKFKSGKSKHKFIAFTSPPEATIRPPSFEYASEFPPPTGMRAPWRYISPGEKRFIIKVNEPPHIVIPEQKINKNFPNSATSEPKILKLNQEFVQFMSNYKPSCANITEKKTPEPVSTLCTQSPSSSTANFVTVQKQEICQPVLSSEPLKTEKMTGRKTISKKSKDEKTIKKTDKKAAKSKSQAVSLISTEPKVVDNPSSPPLLELLLKSSSALSSEVMSPESHVPCPREYPALPSGKNRTSSELKTNTAAENSPINYFFLKNDKKIEPQPVNGATHKGVAIELTKPFGSIRVKKIINEMKRSLAGVQTRNGKKKHFEHNLSLRRIIDEKKKSRKISQLKKKRGRKLEGTVIRHFTKITQHEHSYPNYHNALVRRSVSASTSGHHNRDTETVKDSEVKYTVTEIYKPPIKETVSTDNPPLPTANRAEMPPPPPLPPKLSHFQIPTTSSKSLRIIEMNAENKGTPIAVTPTLDEPDRSGAVTPTLDEPVDEPPPLKKIKMSSSDAAGVCKEVPLAVNDANNNPKKYGIDCNISLPHSHHFNCATKKEQLSPTKLPVVDLELDDGVEIIIDLTESDDDSDSDILLSSGNSAESAPIPKRKNDVFDQPVGLEILPTATTKVAIKSDPNTPKSSKSKTEKKVDSSAQNGSNTGMENSSYSESKKRTRNKIEGYLKFKTSRSLNTGKGKPLDEEEPTKKTAAKLQKNSEHRNLNVETFRKEKSFTLEKQKSPNIGGIENHLNSGMSTVSTTATGNRFDVGKEKTSNTDGMEKSLDSGAQKSSTAEAKEILDTREQNSVDVAVSAQPVKQTSCRKEVQLPNGSQPEPHTSTVTPPGQIRTENAIGINEENNISKRGQEILGNDSEKSTQRSEAECDQMKFTEAEHSKNKPVSNELPLSSLASLKRKLPFLSEGANQFNDSCVEPPLCPKSCRSIELNKANKLLTVSIDNVATAASKPKSPIKPLTVTPKTPVINRIIPAAPKPIIIKPKVTPHDHCELCQNQFEHIEEHFVRCHSPGPCKSRKWGRESEYCCGVYFHRFNFGKHHKRHHYNPQSGSCDHQCNKCRRKFTKYGYLIDHLVYDHNVCSKPFMDVASSKDKYYSRVRATPKPKKPATDLT